MHNTARDMARSVCEAYSAVVLSVVAGGGVGQGDSPLLSDAECRRLAGTVLIMGVLVFKLATCV